MYIALSLYLKSSLLTPFSFQIISFILCTGCSLNIVFLPKILKYSGFWLFSVIPRFQCVYTHQAGRKLALHQSWQSSEKSQNFKEKTQYLMNTLYYKKYDFTMYVHCTYMYITLSVRMFECSCVRYKALFPFIVIMKLVFGFVCICDDFRCELFCVHLCVKE